MTNIENKPLRPLYLIDGSGFIFRAFYAVPPLKRPDGVQVNAVLGYTNMLMKTIREARAADAELAVIFDAGRITFRNEIYPEYKANRGETPEELIPQFSLIREATKAFNVPSIELKGFEADDLIASYAAEARKNGQEVIVVSSDKDLMQLVEEGVSLQDPMKGKKIGREEVIEKFGVPPEKVTQVQALMGDSSDNIPGVPGIGPKTASQLIQEYGDLETLLARAGEIKQNKRRETLIENSDAARISFELVTLKRDVPLPEPIENLILCDPIAEDLSAFLTEQGFHSILAKLNLSQVHKNEDEKTISLEKSAPIKAEYTLIQDEKALDSWIAAMHKSGLVAIDTETTSLDAMSAEIVGISLSIEAGKACYIPLGHVQKKEENGVTGDLFAAVAQKSDEKTTEEGGDYTQIPLKTVVEKLKPVLEDPSILKIGHNIKYDLLILKNIGLEAKSVEDTMLMSYVLDAGKHRHNLDDLAKIHFDHTNIKFAEVVEKGKTFADIAPQKALDYAAEDAEVTLRLYTMLKPALIQAKLYTVYQQIERPLIPVIVEMESNGVKLDVALLKGLTDSFSIKIKEIEGKIYAMAGEEFNIGSPKQLGTILFEKMGIEGAKKSKKTGNFSTGVAILENLVADGHEIATEILEWRMLSKLVSTYTEALPKQVNAKTGRIHTSFSMAATTTGRLSSSNPNIQNIPIRNEEGREIRKAFIPAAGKTFLAIDYSQVELRLLAEMADLPDLKQAFADGVDIHALTASQVFGIPLDQIDKETRRRAKAINFGIIYGMGAFGLSKQLGCTRVEAAAYIEAYFEAYAGIKEFMESTKDFARANGYVETLFGRRCFTPEINSKNGTFRQFAERQAINAPIQGTAADIMKRAMIHVEKAIQAQNLPAKTLLQVHDELLFEVETDALEAVKAALIPVMENAAAPTLNLSVKLVADAGTGANWNEAH
ncbi:MAG: DNA polymerase I [Alphaproteobacteria bacterium]